MRFGGFLAVALILVACGDGPPQWTEGAELEVSQVTGTSAKLTWALPNDADGLSAIRIKSGGEVLAELGAGNLSYVAENLKGNTEYAFTVDASDMKGNWSKALTAKATTLDGAPPKWPEDASLEIDLESRGILGSRVTFTWTPAVDDVGVTQYKLMRDGESGPEEVGLIPADKTEFVYQSTDVDGRYELWAQDKAGNWSEGGPKVRVWANKGLKLMMQKQGYSTPAGGGFNFKAPRLNLGK